MKLDDPNSITETIEYSELEPIKSLQKALRQALEELGHEVEVIRQFESGKNNNDFFITTDKVHLRITTRRDEKPTVSGEMDIMKPPSATPSKIFNDHELFTSKDFLALDKKKEKQLLAVLRKKVFEKISEESHGSFFRKFYFEFKPNPTSEAILETGTQIKIAVATVAAHTDAETDDLSMTIEK